MLKAIKESSKKVSYGEQIERAKKMVKKNDIVEQMERDWPEMTTEFKRLQQVQYELFLYNKDSAKRWDCRGPTPGKFLKNSISLSTSVDYSFKYGFYIL